MKVFEKLQSMNDRDVQVWLRKVDSIPLGMALLGAEQEIRDIVFRNMSYEARETLEAEMRSYEGMDAKQMLILLNASVLESLI